MRNIRSLSGTWQFQLDPMGELDVKSLHPDREITVPLPWQAAFPELQQYSGYAWYRREFTLESEWLKGEVLLHFGAVDYWCQVFVNGHLAGTHEGGYLPFELPVRAFSRPGINSLAVRVYDPAQNSIETERWPNYKDNKASIVPPFSAISIPHGKQEWYINVGGIWQDVSICAVPAAYIGQVHVTPDIRSGVAEVTVEMAGETATLHEGMINISIAPDGAEPGSWETEVPCRSGQTSYSAQITVPEAKLWQLDDPALYRVRVRAGTGTDRDEVSTRFGFREIASRDGRLFLNGEPLFLLSALDQDLYPGTIYTVPSESMLRDQFRKVKELGFNNLRCHIKPPDPLYLDLADEMGLLVWEEIPSWRTFTNKGNIHPGQLDLDDPTKERVKNTLTEMVARDYNHPSIVIWTIVNEDWGTALPLSADDRAWVREMYEYCKHLDPTRLVTDNSACPAPWGPNIHVMSDLDDFHVYATIPDQARGFEQVIEQFNLRPGWTYSAYSDAVRSGKEPLILSEFGNWGLPLLSNLLDESGKEPDWFKLGPWWSRWEGEPGWPAGVAERFKALGLGDVWPDYEAFATATQWHQYASLKFEIEAMRKQSSIEGYVITELTDAYWEANGMLDFNRNPKVFHDLFGRVNAPDMIIPALNRYACWDNQTPQMKLHGARYGKTGWAGARLRWNIPGNPDGEAKLKGLEQGTAAYLGTQRLVLPKVEELTHLGVEMLLDAENGTPIARNSLDIMLLPASAKLALYREQIAVISEDVVSDAPGFESSALPAMGAQGEPHGLSAYETMFPEDATEQTGGPGDLARSLQELGYEVARHIAQDTKLAISNYPNARLLEWVRDGGDLIFLAKGQSPFFWVQSRGGVYGGQWITAFSWLRPGAYKRLAGAQMPMGMPFRDIMPNATILGLPIENSAMHKDFLAGMTLGWLRHNTVHTVQFRYGKGRVIMTTFALEAALPGDPAAVAMMHDLVDYITTGECNPTLAHNW